MPEPTKLESVPPATVTSSTVKSAADSLSVNVSTAVSPAFRMVRLVAIATVGIFVSIVKAGVSRPDRLALPEVSRNFPAATVTVPTPLKPAVGVNFAV